MKEDFGTQLEDGSLRFVRELPGPIDRVWQYLIDPGKRAKWFCGGTTGDKPGDAYTQAFNHDDLSHEKLPESYAHMQGGIEMGARIVRIDPPELLVFRWDDGGEETRIELSEQGAGVRLVLIQSPPPALSQIAGMASGWHAHLGILIDQLSGEAPRGFWTEHAAAEAHYSKVIQVAD